MRIVCGFLLLVLLSGCVHRYQVTLTNDNVITTKTKPRLNRLESAYTFKDLQGEQRTIPVFRIKEISPRY